MDTSALRRCPPLVRALAAVGCCLILVSVVCPAALGAPARLVTPTSPPVWTAGGEQRWEDFGYSLAAAGDVNRDGYGDVIVGAPGWGPADSWRGRALVYLGSASGLSPQPAWTLLGNRMDGGLGYSVAGCGDVNGDGFGDVVIGEYGFDGGHRPYRGRALVAPGSPNGPRADRAWSLAGETDHEYFGEYVAGAGDVNGDGLADVLVGCDRRSVLYFGRRGGSGPVPAWTGPGASSFAGAGDVNGDGYDDILIGTTLYAGSSAGPSGAPVWSAPWGPSASGGGDLNGDGYDDVAVGTYAQFKAPARIYAGSAAGLSPTPAWEISDAGLFWADFGYSLSVAGDVNGDGFADLAVTAPEHGEAPLARIPQIQVYLGGPAGPSPTPAWMAVGPHWTDSNDMHLALGADVNGDGSSEVLAGWADAQVGDIYSGRADLYSLGPAYPGPAILHEPVVLAPVDQPVDFEAVVTDQTHSVARVELLYRQIWNAEYGAPVAMSRVEGDRYRATLTAEQVGLVGLVYIVRAYDDYGISAETAPIGLDVIYPDGSTRTASRFEVRSIAGAGGGPAQLRFATSRAGPARVRLFDVQGRLVATPMDEPLLPRGGHVVTLGSVEARRAASGVLFYSVETVDGVRGGRLVLIR
jgi:hypothetical protein